MKDLSLKEHYQNQNFNIIHEFFWGFGTAFHTVYAVVPLFLKKLGAPEAIAVSFQEFEKVNKCFYKS